MTSATSAATTTTSPLQTKSAAYSAALSRVEFDMHRSVGLVCSLSFVRCVALYFSFGRTCGPPRSRHALPLLGCPRRYANRSLPFDERFVMDRLLLGWQVFPPPNRSLRVEQRQ